MIKNFTRSLFFSALFLLPAAVINAQDFSFSQFYEQPLLRNPALAGIFTGDLRVSMAYRDQWGSVTVPFRTTALSIEHKIPVGSGNDILTIGSQMSLDGAGDLRLKRTMIQPAINFHKSLSDDKDTYLSFAFMGGPVSSQFDATQLKMGDQYQGGSVNGPTAQPIRSTGYSYWDLTAGVSFSSTLGDKTNFYVGAALAHVTNPVIKSVTGSSVNDVLAPRLSLNAGINAPSGDNGHFIAFADYFKQGEHRQLLGGIMYGMNLRQYDYGSTPDILYIGSFMRWDDALIPTIKMEFEHFSVGVSYDINISKLKVVSNWRGGLELTATYRDFLKIRNSTLDKVRCVKF